MLRDYATLISNAQAITASAASSDYIDTVESGGAIDGGTMVFKCGANFNTLTSLTIALQSSSATNFSPAKTLISTSVPLASLVANTIVAKLPLPKDRDRYIRAYYTVVGSNPSAGNITAFCAEAPIQGVS